jgi:RNA polymerase sigma factor (sigma-70 family)
MPTNPLIDVLQHVRRTELLREGQNTTDGELLECWVRRRDSVALEALVLRHGPMVWGICCRALPNHHDAEDAFQAAFLVFVRKAASVRTPELLANWLYGVALQTARKARQAAGKRQAREKQVPQLPEPKARSQNQQFGPDAQRLLDEELGRLPDKYRIAVLLCYFQGKSRPEAARQLRLPEGTVGSRLDRGRTMLARRLARRGLTVAPDTLAVALPRQAPSTGVPAVLLSNTIKAASLLAAGEGVGAVTAQVSALAKGVGTTIPLPKWKTAALVLFIGGFVLAGGLVTNHILAPPQNTPGPNTPGPKPAPPGRPRLILSRHLHGFDPTSFHPSEAVAVSPDGRFVASGVGGQYPVELYDADTFTPIRGFEGRMPTVGLRGWAVEQNFIGCVAFSPDSKTIVALGTLGSVRWWNVSTGEVLQTKQADDKDSPLGISFSSDSRRFATAGPHKVVKVWDVTTGAEVLRLQHSGPVKAAIFRPDGKRILTFEEEGFLVGHVKEWDAATGAFIRESKIEEKRVFFLMALYYRGDSLRVVTQAANPDRRGPNTVVWDGDSGRQLSGLDAWDCAGISPDRKWLVTSDMHENTLHVWDLETGDEMTRFHSERPYGGMISNHRWVAFSADGNRIFRYEDELTVWDLVKRP